MLSALRKFISWAFLKLVFGAFLATSLVVIYALWLYQHDEPDFAAVRTRYVLGLSARLTAAQAARDATSQELAQLHQQFAAFQDRAARAQSIADDLKSQQSLWKKWVSDRDQQRINAGRIEHLEAMSREATEASDKLRRDLTRTTVRLEHNEREVLRSSEQLHLAGRTDSIEVHYLYLAWVGIKWFVLAALGLYYFGRILRKLVFFYYIAPWIARSRAVQLSAKTAVSPWLGASHTSLETSLWPGEKARVRKRYLLAVDDEVVRESHYLLSWRFPVTSLLSGYVHDVNLRNIRAGHEYRLAFAHHKNPDNEMAIVHVPEGGSLVVRPSFLAGVILPPGQKLKVRRRWQLFRWQAWLTGQLRFVEFAGPCRLIVAGRPGLHAERLVAGEDDAAPSYRIGQGRTIGFTPNLEYRLVRTTRFWDYYRRDRPLFDTCFVGVGFVLLQTLKPGRHTGLWSTTRNRARRIIGL